MLGKGGTEDPRQQVPNRFHHLQAMLDVVVSVSLSPYEASLFAAAFSLAFFGAFRISELVARSKEDRTGDALGIMDIAGEGALTIQLRRSKTDQARKGVEIVLSPLGDPRYCPVATVKRFLELCPAAPGYLLIHADQVPLTKFQFERVMTGCLSRAGLLMAGKRYSSHSFRIGAATSAFLAGLEPERVKKIGRWDSPCYKRYIRP